MTKPRIEEIAKEISDCVYYDRQDEVVHVDLEEIEGILRKLHRIAHQAGIDKAVEHLKKNGEEAVEGLWYISESNFKALQDNK